jgi:methylenetetrahydrofolate dehydrogenase (NADP+) / methenyltetrahydrofolate cyclohydrolase
MLLNGKEIGIAIKKKLRKEIEELKAKDIDPCLAVVIVGDDQASQIYVRQKEKAAKDIGIRSLVHRLDSETPEDSLVSLITQLNNDQTVHGILVQLPLPRHINEKNIINSIAPEKDVDCFHPTNVGKMVIGDAYLFPCTPLGIMEMLKYEGIEVSGKKCVVIGRSNIVGKPMALMLLNAGATVTICHSLTKDLAAECLTADVIVSAAGKSGLIRADMIQEGAVVIDVGINRQEDGKVVGDVDFLAVSKKASAITPVPGGVGPMTIAMLMKNTVEAAKNSR